MEPHEELETPRLNWRDAPGMFADRLGVSVTAVVVGVLAVGAAALGGWWALAAPSSPPADDLLPRIDAVSVPTSATTLATQSALVVHVDGAVLAPGVHEVRPGSRVIDAIEAAGGLRADADRARLNLALLVDDQQRIWVPAVGEEEPGVVLPEGGSTGSESGAAPTGALVDINQAAPSQLETLPGIGPSLAAAIVDHRTRHGAFRTIEDLLEVTGIGPAKFAQIEPLVRV